MVSGRRDEARAGEVRRSGDEGEERIAEAECVRAVPESVRVGLGSARASRTWRERAASGVGEGKEESARAAAGRAREKASAAQEKRLLAVPLDQPSPSLPYRTPITLVDCDRKDAVAAWSNRGAACARLIRLARIAREELRKTRRDLIARDARQGSRA